MRRQKKSRKSLSSKKRLRFYTLWHPLRAKKKLLINFPLWLAEKALIWWLVKLLTFDHESGETSSVNVQKHSTRRWILIFLSYKWFFLKLSRKTLSMKEEEKCLIITFCVSAQQFYIELIITWVMMDAFGWRDLKKWINFLTSTNIFFEKLSMQKYFPELFFWISLHC